MVSTEKGKEGEFQPGKGKKEVMSPQPRSTPLKGVGE